MRKWISIFAVLFLMFTVPAFATPDPDNHSIGSNNLGAATTGSGSAAVGNSGTISATGVTGDVTGNSGTIQGGAGGAGGAGGNASVSHSGNSTNTIGSGIGNFSPHATGGNASATGGNANATGGNATSSSSSGASSNLTNTTNITANPINTNTFNPTSTNTQHQGQGQGQLQGQQQGQGQGQKQSVNNMQTISPSQTLIQNVAAPAPGMGREFAPNLGGPIPTTIMYRETTGKGWTVIPPELLDKAGIPRKLTMKEAEKLLSGKAKYTMRVTEDLKYGFDYCERFDSIPSGAMYMGRIYLRTSQPFVFGEPGVTDDLVAQAAKQAMLAGRNGFAIVKQSETSDPKSVTLGIGLAYTGAKLEGSEKDTANTYGGGTGFAYSSGTREYNDTMVVVIFQTAKGQKEVIQQTGTPKAVILPVAPIPAIKKEAIKVKIESSSILAPAAPKPDLTPVIVKPVAPVQDYFRCIATGTYTPPADCK